MNKAWKSRAHGRLVSRNLSLKFSGPVFTEPGWKKNGGQAAERSLMRCCRNGIRIKSAGRRVRISEVLSQPFYQYYNFADARPSGCTQEMAVLPHPIRICYSHLLVTSVRNST
jgi:hypothetical protein